MRKISEKELKKIEYVYKKEESLRRIRKGIEKLSLEA